MFQLMIPTERRKAGRQHPLWWVGWDEAVGSLVKVAGRWQLVKSPQEDPQFEGFFGGGRVHVVSDEVAAELTEDGFGNMLLVAVEASHDFTEDYG